MAKITVEYLRYLIWLYNGEENRDLNKFADSINEKAAEGEPCECEIYKPESIDRLNCRECGGLPLPNKPVNSQPK